MEDIEREPVKVQFICPELKDAYLNGDFTRINNSKENINNDFHPLVDLLERHSEDEVFNQVKDRDGNYISVIASTSGIFYCQVKDSDGAVMDPDPTTPRTIKKPIVQIGWYSENGGRAESTQFWSLETFEQVTVLGISTALGYVLGNLVTKMLTGRVSQAAANAAAEASTAYAAKKSAEDSLHKAISSGDETAIEAATTALQNARNAANNAFLNGASKFVNPTRWAKIAAFFNRFSQDTGEVIGLVVPIGIQLFLDFVWGKINKDFSIEVEIFNFDEKVWKVDAFYQDNDIIAGAGEISADSMPAVTGMDKFPWGEPIQSWPAAFGVTYTFRNSSTLLGGNGIPLRTIQESQPVVGFALGYIVNALAEYHLAANAEASPSVQDFYDDEGNCPRDKPKSMQCVLKTVDGNITVRGHTNALGGKDDHVSQYILTIGS